MTLIELSDPADPRLDDYRTLSDPELRKRYEGEAGVFIAESPVVVERLLDSTYVTKSVVLTPDLVDRVAPALEGRGIATYVITRDLLREVVRFRLHKGALACALRPKSHPIEPILEAGGLITVLEQVSDPENVGALFRNVRALGVAGTLLGPGCADPLYRRCVRVSMGHVLHSPFAHVPSMAEIVPTLRAAGFTTLALTPDPLAPDLREVARTHPALAPGPDRRVAVMLGAEGPGLTDEARAAADLEVRIAMDPEVDSLNVTTAGALAYYALG